MKLPLGYRYAAAYAGIRRDHQDDVGLIVPDTVAQAAALFTVNIVQAAPVLMAKRHLRSSNGKVAAILVNAGNANCATRTGERVALASCKAVAKALKTRPEYVLPASTGVIGVELDSRLLTETVPNLVGSLSRDAFEAVARAIMTTDTRIKVASEEIRLGGKTVSVAGMTKGAGMIHPKMATTLGFVMTDAVIAPDYLREMLSSAIGRTYSCLTVDGDTSTNDMVALLANGASGIKPNKQERRTLQELITSVMESLARQIAADGEGARKLIEVQADGFKREHEARMVARSVANSLLVKTAIAGNDPNWGRILAAVGYSGMSFDASDVDIYLQEVLVCRRGLAADFNEAELKRKLDVSEVHIRIVLNGRGKSRARFFTCDLTQEYVKINAGYRT